MSTFFSANRRNTGQSEWTFLAFKWPSAVSARMRIAESIQLQVQGGKLSAASWLVFGRISISLRFSSVIRLDFQQAVSFFRSRRMLKNHPGAVCAFYAGRRVARNRVGRGSLGRKCSSPTGKPGRAPLVCIMLQKQRKALPCKPLTERTSQQIEVEACKSPTWSFARRSHRRNRPRGLNYEIQ